MKSKLPGQFMDIDIEHIRYTLLSKPGKADCLVARSRHVYCEYHLIAINYFSSNGQPNACLLLLCINPSTLNYSCRQIGSIAGGSILLPDFFVCVFGKNRLEL